jgi:hypothetical protein
VKVHLYPGLQPGAAQRRPDAAPPLPPPSGLVVAVGAHGRVVAVWTDIEHAAGRGPNLSDPVTLHELPLSATPQVGQPLA